VLAAWSLGRASFKMGDVGVPSGTGAEKGKGSAFYVVLGNVL